jgi:hypothetical protein
MQGVPYQGAPPAEDSYAPEVLLERAQQSALSIPEISTVVDDYDLQNAVIEHLEAHRDHNRPQRRPRIMAALRIHTCLKQPCARRRRPLRPAALL